MKPTRRPILTASRLALAPLLALAACVPPPSPTPAPTPAPAPRPTPAPAPVVQPAPPTLGWQDMPVTPGDWTYSAGTAQFGQRGYQPLLTLRCDAASRTVEIARFGATAAVPMIVRAEAMERSVGAALSAEASPRLIARVSARDPLLDAMAFSKGRFAIEASGLPTLYVPPYPEVTRVIEDCR